MNVLPSNVVTQKCYKDDSTETIHLFQDLSPYHTELCGTRIWEIQEEQGVLPGAYEDHRPMLPGP